ncbi:hypothetical protein GWK47_053385 [Chionoecetes opilio]|uniref:Uncharacterized protein n=1 Tax=Chionoecetes opilio TaxID=41210 RepID=A0A8J4Y813_CHIOP|nr:hypothetical protein GWK47_053385 [Chionoecetes opilio]
MGALSHPLHPTSSTSAGGASPLPATSWAGKVPAKPHLVNKQIIRLQRCPPIHPDLTCGHGSASSTRSRPPGGRPCRGALQGATQETGWDRPVYWDNQCWRRFFTSAKDTIGRWRPRDCASMMCRALQQQSITDSSRQGIGFLVLQPVLRVCPEKSPPYAALAGGNLCSVQPNSQRPRGTTSRGRSACHRLVPKEGTASSSLAAKTSARHRHKPLQDFRRQELKT